MDLKECSKCRKSKPLDEFYSDPRHKDGRQSACIECHKGANKKWRKTNKKKVGEYNRERRTKIEYHYVLYNERAKSLGLRTGFKTEEVNEVLKHWANKCAYCGDKASAISHIIPLDAKNRGPNIKHNLVPSCQKCLEARTDIDIFFYAVTTGKPIVSILVWAAGDPVLIKQLNDMRERFYDHSFKDEMIVALKAAKNKS